MNSIKYSISVDYREPSGTTDNYNRTISDFHSKDKIIITKLLFKYENHIQLTKNYGYNCVILETKNLINNHIRSNI